MVEYFIDSIRDGAYDPCRDNETLSVVHCDERSWYYNLSGTGLTMSEFKDFVSLMWDSTDVSVVENNGSFRAWVS